VSVMSDSECWLCLLKKTVKILQGKLFKRSQNVLKSGGSERQIKEQTVHFEFVYIVLIIH
jgi:hypothetical protein